MNERGSVLSEGQSRNGQGFLFVACFVALVTTSFAFFIRVWLMDKWQVEFGFSETQKGEIFGAGMWPFGLSIVLFSLVIDKIGYGRSMIFAFACHAASAVLMVTARGYWELYVGSLLNGLAAGTVEAVINPAIASTYPKRKTAMLTILHAGWPGGMVLAGLMGLAMKGLSIDNWRINVLLTLLPTLAYGLMMLRCKFPVSERVVAGVPYKDMLREAGAIGWLIVVYLVGMEVNRVLTDTFPGKLPAPWLGGNLLDTTFLDLPSLGMTIVIAMLVAMYLVYTKSGGRPMYVFLLLVMILLAITELGTDTWIAELMRPAMSAIGLPAALVLVYTATIMMVLRFCIAPIERLLRPLGVLLVSSLLAAAGLYLLSRAEGGWILLWATVYGAGQCFFWPVTLGLVSEQFPRGGALTLNAIAGVGMLGVGIVGSQMLGFWQDRRIDSQLQPKPALYGKLMDSNDKKSIFGAYKALDSAKVNETEDKIALHDHKQARVRELAIQRITMDMSAQAKKQFLADAKLAGKLGDQQKAKTLTEQQQVLAKATQEKIDAAIAAMPAEEVSASLAEDRMYQTLVRNALDHLKPSEPKKPGDEAPDEQRAKYESDKAAYDVGLAAWKSADTFDKRLEFLAGKGYFVSDEQFQDVKETKKVLDEARADAKRNAMAKVAYLPLIMAGCYMGLILYFRAKGGYTAVELTPNGQVTGRHEVTAEEAAKDAAKAPWR